MLEKIGGKIWNLLSRFIIFMVNLLLTPFHKKLTDEQAEAFLQFCKFAIVGVTNTLLSYGINIIVLLTCNANGILQKNDIKTYVADTIAFILSVIWSFYWNNRYVFTEDADAKKRVWWKTLLKTYAAYSVTGIGLSFLINRVFVTMLGINEYLVLIIKLVVSVPVNFLINKFWAFKQEKKEES